MFFVRYLAFVFFWEYLGLKRPHIFGEKRKRKQKTIRNRLGKGTLDACAKFQGLTLKNGVENWDYCAVECKKQGLTSYLLGVSMYSILGFKFDLILVLRSQFFDFLRETLYKYALEHLKAAGPEKKGTFFSCYRKCLCIIDLFEVL